MFISTLSTEAVLKLKLYRLTKPLIYLSDIKKCFVIPCGFSTDLASIPQPFLSFIRPHKIREPAVLHDYLLDNHEKLGISVKGCDQLLVEAMYSVEASPFEATLVYLAVRTYHILTGK